MKTTRREFSMFSSAALAGIGLTTLTQGASLFAKTADFDVMPYVDPELRPGAKRLAEMIREPVSAGTLAARRKLSFTMPPLPEPGWTQRTIAGRNGGPDVGICIVNAKPDGPARPVIVHMHGGGYVLGSAAQFVRQLQEISQALDCVIVSVDYRLAPETRFPGSLEDNYAGLLWVYRNAAEIGADPRRVAVMGESAGGGHAAMLAIAARDRGEVPIIYQALVYPMLDDRTGSTRQVPPYLGALLWTPADNRFGWTSLLGMPAGSAKVPYGSVPARVENLKGLPPAYIGVGSIDLFVDEDIAFARRLIDAGIPVKLEVVPGAYHAFDMDPNTSLSRNFRASLISALKRAFEPPA